MIIGITPEEERMLEAKAAEKKTAETAAFGRVRDAGPQLNATSTSIQQDGPTKESCAALGGLLTGSASDLAIMADATAWLRRAHMITPQQEAARTQAITTIRQTTAEITAPAEQSCKNEGYKVPVSTPAPKP